jgi:hypothetical protein
MSLTKKHLLLISNLTLHGSGSLDHAEAAIRGFLGKPLRVLFWRIDQRSFGVSLRDSLP